MKRDKNKNVTPLIIITQTPGCGAHHRFIGLEPAVGLHPALWTADQYYISSVTCCYIPGFYFGTELYCSATEVRGCEQLA